MTPKTCASSDCDTEFTSARPDKKYCSSTCSSREKSRRHREANPEKYRENARRRRAANPEKEREYSRKYREANPEKVRERYRAKGRKRYYEKTKPRGIILDQRLWDMFQRQALRDPNGLPELAERVLEWKPKGFAAEKQFVLYHGTTERDWMYYIELTPEEATMQWQDEAA